MSETADCPVALVTGGSKGIGRAVCVEMAKSGYHVVINYHSDAAGAIGEVRAAFELQADPVERRPLVIDRLGG